MTYEEFSKTMQHESGAHHTELLSYAEINRRNNRYWVFFPITDADVEMGLSHLVDIYPTYDAAERAMYDCAVKNNML